MSLGSGQFGRCALSLRRCGFLWIHLAFSMGVDLCGFSPLALCCPWFLLISLPVFAFSCAPFAFHQSRGSVFERWPQWVLAMWRSCLLGLRWSISLWLGILPRRVGIWSTEGLKIGCIRCLLLLVCVFCSLLILSTISLCWVCVRRALVVPSWWLI